MSVVAHIKERVSQADSKIKDGKVMVEVSLSDINRLFELAYLAERAQHIMSFHTLRCPMNIMKNFSGSEEHLAEYRMVMKEIKEKI